MTNKVIKRSIYLIKSLPPKTSREWITVIFLLISFIILLVTIYLSTQQNIQPKSQENFFNSHFFKTLINTVGISISSAGLATTLIEFINQISIRVGKFLNQGMFSTLFGCDDFENYSVIIVIPAFPIERNTSITVNTNDPKDLAAKILSRINSRAAVESDVVAGSYLITLFSKIFLQTNSHFMPEVVWDEDLVNSFNFNEDTGARKKSRDVYILIGFSNRIFDILNNIKNTEEKYFFIEREIEQNNDGLKIKNTIFSAFSNKLGIELEVKAWHSDSVYCNEEGVLLSPYDYALFSKVYLNNKTIIICGGITEFGTRQIAKYINIYWKDIYAQLEDEKKGSLISSDSFVAVYRVPVKMNKSDEILPERCYIRRIKNPL